jgi:hypothetical protein
MKTRLHRILPAFLILLATNAGSMAQPKPAYSPTAARDAVEAACKQAARESKAVFIKSGYPACRWCRAFDRYHADAQVRPIIEKYYVVVAIDTENMPDGTAVFTQYAKPSAPSWVIISPQQIVIVDSYAPEGNVGYPEEANELPYYLAALKKAAPAITDAELHTLGEQIHKFAKKQPAAAAPQ